jgi:HSP20 family protein
MALMTLRRQDPLQDLLSLQERMNRLFEESLKTRMDLEAGGQGWQPLADVYETAEAIVVLVELPGVEQEDVEIQVDGESVIVRGRRRLGSARPEIYHRMERSYGSFARSFQLSGLVDAEGVRAVFKDGLLRLELPKLRA